MLEAKKSVSITLHRVANRRVWIHLALSLGKHPLQGDLIEYADGFLCNINPLDEEAAEAFQEQEAEDQAEAKQEGFEFVSIWGGYVAEGSRHAFRKLKEQQRVVLLNCLEGCIGLDGDAEGIVFATICGLLSILNKNPDAAVTPGWEITSCIVS